ncbi:uncharacterized protein LOC110993658 [Pieris rapae]|uniref:uncharacterized protein LOC110993658 n=1 Tax=Pieris rapae TaxID=64459 RepID=UPI001E27A56B|nr:uncharacterized protein LOC110993658 [Pieris rapae]
MLAYLLLGLIATVSAAPHKEINKDDDDQTLKNFITNKFNKIEAESRDFWQQYEREMKTFEDKMNALSRHFPNPILAEGFDGDKYVIKVSLHGFEEDDILVQTKKTAVVIEAHHSNGNSKNNFFNVRTLPSEVKSGFWTYEDDILTVECELE